MGKLDAKTINHFLADIRINGSRFTRASVIHLGEKNGVQIRPIRSERIATVSAVFARARLTIEDIAQLADGNEVKGSSCHTLGIRRQEAQAVLLIQYAQQKYGSRLTDSAKQAMQHVGKLTQRRLKDIVAK